MCFSKESSIISYLAGLIPSYLLLISDNKYNKHIGLFCLVFIQMQFAEFLMWSDINCKNKLNQYGSKFAHIILSFQPLSILIGAYYFKTTILDQKLLLALTLIYTILFLIAIYHQFFKKKVKLCSKTNKRGQLIWDFNINREGIVWKVSFIIYLILVLFFFFFLKDKIKGYLMSFLSLGSFLLAIISTKSITPKKIFAEWESKWCFLAVIIPTVIKLL